MENEKRNESSDKSPARALVPVTRLRQEADDVPVVAYGCSKESRQVQKWNPKPVSLDFTQRCATCVSALVKINYQHQLAKKLN